MPVVGAFFVVAGIAMALFGLMQPRRTTVEPVSRFGRLFNAMFLLLFVGFVFLCGELGLGIRWMGVVGMILSAPFVVACVVLVVWVIPRDLRRPGQGTTTPAIARHPTR